MRTASIVSAALVFGAPTLAMTRDAHALGPVDVEIGVKAGMATSPLGSTPPPTLTSTSYLTMPIPIAAPDPLGFGLGVRGGVDFLGFYGGVQTTYYLGGSTHAPLGGASLTWSSHTLMYGIEAGYGITLGALTIRPQIGIGNAAFSASLSDSAAANVSRGSVDNLYLEPGLTFLVSLGRWFVGADANLLFFPGMKELFGHDLQASLSLHGQLGLKF